MEKHLSRIGFYKVGGIIGEVLCYHSNAIDLSVIGNTNYVENKKSLGSG